MDAYDNLLKCWERDTIGHLQLSANSLVHNTGISEAEINQYDAENFNRYFAEKTVAAPQNEKINVFTHTIQKDVEKYSEQIKLCYEEFKHYM